MLKIKELQLLRSAIDEADPQLYSQEEYQLLQEIRGKICDLITLREAWNRGKHIQMEDVTF